MYKQPQKYFILPVMYIEATHDEFLARSSTRPCVIQFVVALTSHSGEWNLRYYGLWEEHVRSVVGA